MTVSRILSSAATIHAARAYVEPGQTVSAMFNAHNERRASVGLALSALLADDRSMYLPRFDADPYSDRYRHELQFIGLVFQDGAQHVDHAEQRAGGFTLCIGQGRQRVERAVQVTGTVDKD